MSTTDNHEITMPYVCLYASYVRLLKPYTDAQKGRLLSAMLQYLTTGEVPAFKGNERYIWTAFQDQIDRDQAAYEKRCLANRANGSKGGRPSSKSQDNPEEPKITDGFLEEPKKPKEKEKEKENENENENESEKESEKEFTAHAGEQPQRSVSPSPAFVPPTQAQVDAYCTQKGYRIDTGRFVSYYTAIGWCIGKSPMQDWKAAVDNWNRKELHDGKAEPEPTWTIGVRL